MIVTYGKWLIRWRYPVLLLGIILVATAASGIRLIHFNTDYRVFFGEENPQLQAFEELQNTYTKTDNILFVLVPADGDVFTPHTLAVVEKLTDQAWQIPYSIRVDSISNFQHTVAEEDDLIVDDLVIGAATLSDEELEQIRQIATSEPLLARRLISPDSRVTGINVTVQLPGIDPEAEVPEAAAFARNLAAGLRAENPDLQVYLTGMVMMNNAFPEASKQDMGTLVPLMFLVVILALGFLLRSLTGTVGTVFVIVFSILTAMGLTGWLEIALTPPSANAPTMILTLAVAHCVHILVSFLQAMRRGLDKAAAMIESLRINLQPVFLTSLTTAIGFLSMNFSDSPPFRDLGNIVAMGVVAGFFYAVSFLPALIMVLPVRVKPARSTPGRAMEQFAEFVIARRKTLLWGMGLLTLLLVSFIPRNELNDEFVKYFDETVNFRQATDFTTENLTGIYSINYSLKGEESGGISEPEFLELLEAFARWFEQQPETLHVETLTDTMKRLNKNMHADDPAWYRLPGERNLAAQYLLLYEMSLPYGLDLNNQINVDKSATRLRVTLQSISSNGMMELEERAQQWLDSNTPDSMHAHGVSPTVMFSHLGQRNIRSMLTGTTLALLLISFILIFALRSVKIGLISMIPNLVPAAIAFGLWGLFVGQVGLGLSVVTGMTLGIVVDDTVHFLSKYLRARHEQDMTPPDAVRYAFSTVGTALWITSLVLVAGFLILRLSTFELNSGMGLLTAMTIAIALIADFLLLPPLLMKLEEKDFAKDMVTDTA